MLLSGTVSASLCPVQVFVFLVVASCFYFEVWRHPYVPLKFPVCVIVCSILMCFTCIWLASLPYVYFSCVLLSVCFRSFAIFSSTSAFSFPAWFPVCVLLLDLCTSALIPDHLVLTSASFNDCVSGWLSGSSLCPQTRTWYSDTFAELDSSWGS